MKKLLIFVLAIVSLGAAQNLDQAQGFGTSAQAIKFTVVNDRAAHRFEYVYGGSLSTVSTVLKGCMRGDTCDTLETSTSTSNTNRCVRDSYDYFTVTPTFTGGTSPTLTVNMTSGPSSVCTNTLVLSTGTSAQQVQGTAADGAAASGSPVQVGGVDGSANAQALLTDTSGRPSVTGQAATGTAITGLNPVYVGCDSSTSGTVTQGQVEAVRCKTDGGLIVGSGSLALADGNGNTVNTPSTAGNGQINYEVNPLLYNGSTWDRTRSVVNSQDSTGTGILAAGIIGQLDDTSTSAVTENQFSTVRVDARRRLMVTQVQPTLFNCVVAVSTATTIQAVGGSCIAPGASLSLYITDIEFGSSAASGTAADSFPTLKSGTGGTCGTATAVIWQALSTANSTVIANLSQPIKVAANSEACWIMSTAGSKTIQLHGYIAP